MKQEPVLYVKRLAEFVGQPFSAEEESEGVVDQIIKLCSFEHLSSLEIKKTAQLQEPNASSLKFVVNNRDFFRKGQIGDWKHHFTDEMAKRVDHITGEKIKGSGLTFG
ncbi:flavonol sulfotransferase-like [Pyrus x bretschneideri]|uniref:flavonol sulfotransferase-like n=1 Tax=Pyrus x bretschneideri TaxID=225117 RepID=UPI00202FC04B|nr:flavonol sulfotransferase-like [Pyrus x bretschneideri]